MAPGPGEQEFRELIQKFEDALRKVHEKANEIVNNVNRILSKVPGFVGDGIRKGTERFIALLNKIYEELDKYIGKPGWPPTLLSTGNAWADDVGTPVSSLAGAADPGWADRRGRLHSFRVRRAGRAVHRRRRVSGVPGGADRR